MFIKPIPLTEQWLKDFNYNNEGKYWYNKDRSYRIHKVANTWVIESHYVKFQNEEKLISEWVFITDFQYVHQLQNLIFELTDEELKKKS